MSDALFDEAMSLAKGSYQEDLISGGETWSGSSLKGAAAKWGAKYAQSRASLLERLEESGVAYLTKGLRGKIELVIGRPPSYYIRVPVNCGGAWVPGPKTVLDEILEAVDASAEIG